MVGWAFQSQRAKIGDQEANLASVQALALGEQIEVVELLKQLRRGLMNGADDRASALSQAFEQRDALIARGTVQTAGRLVEEHHWQKKN